MVFNLLAAAQRISLCRWSAEPPEPNTPVTTLLYRLDDRGLEDAGEQ
jgi:hypothetical protein